MGVRTSRIVAFLLATGSSLACHAVPVFTIAPEPVGLASAVALPMLATPAYQHPVPLIPLAEPQVYAMLVLGIGLIALVGRNKDQSSPWASTPVD